jgi:hypothetical protein
MRNRRRNHHCPERDALPLHIKNPRQNHQVQKISHVRKLHEIIQLRIRKSREPSRRMDAAKVVIEQNQPPVEPPRKNRMHQPLQLLEKKKRKSPTDTNAARIAQPNSQNASLPMQATQFPPQSHSAPQNNAKRAEHSGGTPPIALASNSNNQTSPTQTRHKRSIPPPADVAPRSTAHPQTQTQTSPRWKPMRHALFSSRRPRRQLLRHRVWNLFKGFLPLARFPPALPRHPRQIARRIHRNRFSNNFEHP